MPNITAPIPFVLQDNFISVVINGEAHTLSKGDPTFKKLHSALSKAQWKRVPNLISLAVQVAEKSRGRVEVKNGGVYYKGSLIHNTMTAKILELIENNKPVRHLLKFMDNLYRQPDPATINEVYDWLSNGRFALTDDGCFIAYKKVDANFKDCYTHTIDNSVGQIVTMPRKAVDPDRRHECSQGLHFCSKGYLNNFGGDHIMEIKINPADVVAIPQDYGYTKGRTWRYEVLREVLPGEMIEGKTDSPVMMQPVVEIAKERKALLKQLKALPSVKRMVRNGKLTATSFRKASSARLRSWLLRFSRQDIAPTASKLNDNPLRFAREAAGLTCGQVAKAAGMETKDVYNAERSQTPLQSIIDSILEGIATLQYGSGVSYPRASLAAHEIAQSLSHSYYEEDEEDEEGYPDPEDEDDDDEGDYDKYEPDDIDEDED